MAFDASFLIALLLLILGSGCLKGNISAQVGQLYPVEAESLRTQGYTIFSAAINVGAVVGPLVCGGVAAAYGWHAGFGVAGVLMLVALVTYLAGQRHLPGGRSRKERVDYPPLTTAERRRVWLLILLIAIAVLPMISYTMIWNIGVLWVDQHAILSTGLGDIPASWFNSVDSFFSIIAVPPLVALWRWQAKRGREPGDIGKIGIGMVLTGASALFMVAGSLISGADGRAAVLVAARLLRRHGHRLPLLLAGFAGPGLARRPGEGERDDDERRLPCSVRRQRADGLARQLLWRDASGPVLGDRRCHQPLPAA